jgi:hypothetical protein
MANPFDVTVQLASYLHPTVCGRTHDFEPIHCLLAQEAAERLRDELRVAGIVAVPIETVDHLERAFGEFVEGKSGLVAAAPKPGGHAHDLYFGHVRVRVKRRDGTVSHSDPMHRWLAELELGALNFDHGHDVVGASIEPEPAWVTDLVNGGSLSFGA